MTATMPTACPSRCTTRRATASAVPRNPAASRFTACCATGRAPSVRRRKRRQLSAPAVAEDVRVSIDVFSVPSQTSLAQPSLRGPPVSSQLRVDIGGSPPSYSTSVTGDAHGCTYAHSGVRRVRRGPGDDIPGGRAGRRAPFRTIVELIERHSTRGRHCTNR